MASELNVGGITTTGNVGIGCTAESALQVQGTFVGSGVPTAAGLHAGMSGNHCLVQLVANGSNGSPYIDFSNVPEDVDFRIIEAGDGSTLTIQPYGVAGLEMSTAGLCTFGNGIDVNTTGNFVKLEAYQHVSVADDATFSLSSGTCGSALISVYEPGSGDGGIFFITYGGAAVLIASSGSVAATDSDGNMCVYKSASSHTATFKNRLGATRSFNVVQLGGYLL